jgi:hypothetical protein
MEIEVLISLGFWKGSGCDTTELKINKKKELEQERPPLFNDRSLQITTKIVVIYAAFYMCTVVFQLLTNPLEDSPLAPQNAYYPLYFMAVVHLIIFVVTGASVVYKKYFWPLTLVAVAIVAMARFYYNDIALWIWSLTS